MPVHRRGGKKRCTFEGCTKAERSRGLCSTHYWQQWAGRELTLVRSHARGLTPKIRFDRLWRFNAETGCWDWEGCIHPRSGYGMFWWSSAAGNVRAHRASWVLYNGDIPDDPTHVYGTMGVLHTCDNKRCVNPDHLFTGTHGSNMRDAIRKHGHRGGKAKSGEANHNAKVTVEIVRAIRASTASQSALGRQYGISRQTVGEIKRREIWAHVEVAMTDLEALTYPRWLHHLFLEPVLVSTLEEAQALPKGYREVPYGEEDRAAAQARSVEAHEQAAQEERAALHRAVEEPIALPPPPPPKAKRAHRRKR
jgi:hypothetical protein